MRKLLTLFLWFFAIACVGILVLVTTHKNSTRLDYIPDNLTPAQKAEAIQKAPKWSALASKEALEHSNRIAQHELQKAQERHLSELQAQQKERGERAFLEGQVYCQEHLKAPRTAIFSKLDWDKDTGYKSLTNGHWFVYGFVDSQNSFGALLRDDWEGILKQNGDHFDLLYLRIGNQKLGSIPTNVFAGP